MRLTLVYFLVFISLGVGAQSELIFVCDSTSREPISFATIAGDTSGFYSHVDGSFPRGLLTEDEYRVTCIGYHPKTLKTNSVLDTFFLAPSPVQLGEAVVKGEYEAYEIGYHGMESHSFKGTNYVTAVFIDSPSLRSQRIEEIIIPFKRLRKGDQFTVFLFSVNEDGEPGKLLFEKDIHYGERSNNFRLSLKGQNILLPNEGVFAGASLLSGQEDKSNGRSPAFPATTEIHEARTYLFSHNNWHFLDNLVNQYWNLAIGLKVRKF